MRERSPSREFNPDAAKGVRFVVRQQSPRAGPRNVSRIAAAGRFCPPMTRAHELLVHKIRARAGKREECGGDVVEKGRERKAKSVGIAPCDGA